MCKKIYAVTGFTPTGPEQLAPLLHADRFPCIFGGERGGKSIDLARGIAVPHILALPSIKFDEFYKPGGAPRFDPKVSKPRNPHFALFGPTYKEPRVEFEYIERDLRKLGKLVEAQLSKPSDGPWRIVTTDGVVVTTISCEVPDGIRSIDLEGAIVCEPGGIMYSAIERIRGRVSSKRGFIAYGGTIENSQRWWKDWQLEGKRPNNSGIVSYLIPSWANTAQFPGGREDPEIKSWWAMLGEDLALERLAAVARPPRYRVLKAVNEDHIRRVDIPEDATIEIWIDPGYATAYAIVWVAMWNEEYAGGTRKRFHFFDELYEQGKTTADMVALCRQMEKWDRVHTGVIDIASKGHRDATDSSLEIWEKLTNIRFNKRYWAEDRLIERIIVSANTKQFTIDPACKGLIAECGLGEPVFPEMHPWRFVTDRDGRVVGEKPEDKWNHSAKCVGYGLLHHLGQVETRRKPTTWNRLAQRSMARR